MVKDLTLTAAGKAKLEEELKELKEVRRPECSKRIAEATAFGDLSENGEYDDAKNEQGIIESRIMEIENILERANVAEVSGRVSKIGVGTTVKIRNVATGKEHTFNIVGSAEADPATGSISDESPVGASLLGLKKGDVAVAETPSGQISFEVLGVAASK